MDEKKVEEQKDTTKEEKVVVPANVSELNIWQRMSAIQGMNIQINKDKAAHGYMYATLDQIMEKLSPIISKYGLLVYHQTDWDKNEKCSYLKTTILNTDKPTEIISSLTYLDSTIVLPGQNKVMVIGSMITYYRRYHVTSLFGLTTETDTDAGGATPSKGKTGGKSVEAAGGGEKAVDFETIFKNMIAKDKTKEVVQKSFESYKAKMNPEQVTAIEALITAMK